MPLFLTIIIVKNIECGGTDTVAAVRLRGTDAFIQYEGGLINVYQSCGNKRFPRFQRSVFSRFLFWG
jgi:hypothetical protein